MRSCHIQGRPRFLGRTSARQLASLIVPYAEIEDHAGSFTFVSRSGDVDRYHLVVLLEVATELWQNPTRFALTGFVHVNTRKQELLSYDLEGICEAEIGDRWRLGRCRTRYELVK